VLGISRLYYTFNEKERTSKIGAGEYALKMVSYKGHVMIQESMRARTGNRKSYYKSPFQKRKDGLHYMDYILEKSHRLFEQGKRK
jgi:hypothetical protein